MTPDETAVWRYRIEQTEQALLTKADKTEMAAVVNELASIKRLLIAVLLAIMAGCIGFGFAAIQIAANVHGS